MHKSYVMTYHAYYVLDVAASLTTMGAKIGHSQKELGCCCMTAVCDCNMQELELEKLAGFRGKVSYAPTRNRQCHMYSIVERPNARSIPLKRVFLRCTPLH